jgi:hypothetical protein
MIQIKVDPTNLVIYGAIINFGRPHHKKTCKNFVYSTKISRFAYPNWCSADY